MIEIFEGCIDLKGCLEFIKRNQINLIQIVWDTDGYGAPTNYYVIYKKQKAQTK